MRIDQVEAGESASNAGKRISTAVLLLGAVLLWPVPLVGVPFLVAGGFGLAISSEAMLAPASPATANRSVDAPRAPEPRSTLHPGISPSGGACPD